MNYHGHLMVSPYNHYFYDTNKNTIIKISKELYEFMHENNDQYVISNNPTIVSKIKKLHANGFLLENPIEEICNTQIDNIEYDLEYKLNQLILQVTKSCNFRCNYCEFTKKEQNNNPTNINNTMSWELAKRAIDFFSEHTKDKRIVYISFYGGEPLIEFELIKKCMLYSSEVFQGKKIIFNLTTNGYLLTSEISKILNEFECMVTLSLDGPSGIHDKNRKLCFNGAGTFDVVSENIRRIYNENPSLISEINCVVDPSNDIDKISDYFKDEHNENVSVRANLVNPQDGSVLSIPKSYTEKKEYFEFVGLLSFLHHGINLDSIFSKEYRRNLEMHKSKMTPIDTLPKKIGHSGPCDVGVTRFFVDVNGSFYACEKVNTSPHMSIGNIENGFNLERVKEQTNITKITEDKCKECWCILHCNLCLVHADDGQKLSVNTVHSECNGVRRVVENKMKDLIALSEAKQLLKTEMESMKYE